MLYYSMHEDLCSISHDVSDAVISMHISALLKFHFHMKQSTLYKGHSSYSQSHTETALWNHGEKNQLQKVLRGILAGLSVHCADKKNK